MVAGGGFEPPSNGLWDRAGTNSSPSREKCWVYFDEAIESLHLAWKTPLCKTTISKHVPIGCHPASAFFFFCKIDGAGRDRTYNLLPTIFNPTLCTNRKGFLGLNRYGNNISRWRRCVGDVLPDWTTAPKMEPAVGIEPTTFWLQIRCSAYWATPAWKIWAEQDFYLHLIGV